MTRRTAWFVHLSTLVVAVTGLIYAWFRYFYVPPEPDPDDLEAMFAATAHPLEPMIQWLHILWAPALVFAVGIIWNAHVWRRIASGFPLRRRTGILLAATFAPMVVSGYALQTSVDELWREIWIWTHVVTSVAFTLGYAWHQVSRPGRDKPAQ